MRPHHTPLEPRWVGVKGDGFAPLPVFDPWGRSPVPVVVRHRSTSKSHVRPWASESNARRAGFESRSSRSFLFNNVPARRRSQRVADKGQDRLGSRQFASHCHQLVIRPGVVTRIIFEPAGRITSSLKSLTGRTRARERDKNAESGNSAKLLLPPLHLENTPDVAPSWLLLFNFAVLSLRHLNEPPRIRKIGRQRSSSISGPFSGFA